MAAATAAGLPRGARVACPRECVVDARLVAPPSAVLRVVAGARGPGLLARTRRLVAGGGPAVVPLRATALGRRLAGAGAPGRLDVVLVVTAADAAGPIGAVRLPVALGPDRPWPVVIGRTRRGRPVVALLPARPAPVLVVSAIHGDEPATADAVRAAVDRVGAGRLRAAVVAVANPDGRVAGTRPNARDVDLNRNFPARDWGRPPVTAPGPRPASEPETRALVRLVRLLGPRRLVTVHAPLALVEDPRRTLLGRFLAARTGLPLRPSVGYPTHGSLGTWARERGIPGVTLELPTGPARPAVVAALAAVLAGSPAG